MTSDKKTAILSAAQKLFREKGLGMSTMEDVAGSAGMGKSSLYYYFKSKEEIFNAVVEMEIGEIILETIKQVSLQQGLLDKLTVFANVKFEMSRNRRSLYRAMEAGMDAEAYSRYQEVKKNIHQKYLLKETVLLQQIMVTAAVRKEIAEFTPRVLDDIIIIFLSALRGINRELHQYGPAGEGASRVASFCQLFYEGLS